MSIVTVEGRIKDAQLVFLRFPQKRRSSWKSWIHERIYIPRPLRRGTFSQVDHDLRAAVTLPRKGLAMRVTIRNGNPYLSDQHDGDHRFGYHNGEPGPFIRVCRPKYWGPKVIRGDRDEHE